MHKYSLCVCLMAHIVLLSGQASDDPMQRFPAGISPPEHRQVEATGGAVDQSRVEPPFWWTDMAESRLQIMLYDREVANFNDVSIDYPGVQLVEVHRVTNPNYLFLDVEITAEAEPGRFPIILSGGSEQYAYQYELRRKTPDPETRDKLGPADLMYLIMPDRFANGDPSNDSYDHLAQTGVERSKSLFRHGGDLVGIMEHLDYLEELGITAIWLNPVLENNQPYDSYHGYATTDFYRVDPRLGNNEQYKYLVDLCHARGVKVVMDVVFNHIGDRHWWINDLPDENWIHQFEDYTPSNFRAEPLMDPYASEADRNTVTGGWFDRHMPDLNQQHELLATYLIQNSIWWAAYTGLDAFRIDTYFYSDPTFMAEWGRRILEEFPNRTFFGETWVHGVVTQAQFTGDNRLRPDINTYLPSVTDFQLQGALMEALRSEQSWNGGISRIYQTLARDFVYRDPFQNVIFLDNHDKSRVFGELEENLQKLKSAVALLLTMRGIPCIYYGTEILLNGQGGIFGEGGRQDFPGGWKGDPDNKFLPEGRTDRENEFFNYLRKLARYRGETSALQDGKLLQFIPTDGIYVYFRYDEYRSVMVAYNSNDTVQTLHTDRFREIMGDYNLARDVISGEMLSGLSEIQLAPHSTLILELAR